MASSTKKFNDVMIERIRTIRCPHENVWKWLEMNKMQPQSFKLRQDIVIPRNENFNCSRAFYPSQNVYGMANISSGSSNSGASNRKTLGEGGDGLCIRGMSIKPIYKRRHLKSPFIRGTKNKGEGYMDVKCNSFVEDSSLVVAGNETPENKENRADPDGFTYRDEKQRFDMKLNEKVSEESSKMASDLITPGYVKQMINRFSSGYSNDYINGIADGNVSEDAKRNSSVCPFKVPLLHSTRSSFKSEKPKPFHYPVLLANRSSIPTKPFFEKSYCRNNSGSEQSSSPASKVKEADTNESSESGFLHQHTETNRLPVLCKFSENTEKCSGCSSNCVVETFNGFSDNESLPPMKHNSSPVAIKISVSDNSVTVGTKNGIYFLNIMAEKEKSLNEKCVESESWLGQDVPDDALGKIRSAIGKAHLLTSKKFQQFAGLCEKNLHGSQEDQFQVTCEDLEGFWDLVMIQVSDVEALFAELQELRNNGWRESKPQDELQVLSMSSKQETPTRSRDATTPTRASARKNKTSDLTAEKLRLRAAIQAGRRQRKTSQNEEEVQIFVMEKS